MVKSNRRKGGNDTILELEESGPQEMSIAETTLSESRFYKMEEQSSPREAQPKEESDAELGGVGHSLATGAETGTAPLVLRLDIKLAENQTKQLVIDRTVEDPWHKANVFCALNGLSQQQAEKLNRVISMNLPKRGDEGEEQDHERATHSH